MVAFLREIKLGRRCLKMDELHGHFEAMGFDGVATYLASGNVILDVASRDPTAVEADIETGLEARLGYDVDTFVRTLPELAAPGARRGEGVEDAPGAAFTSRVGGCLGFRA